jgi:thiol:disulfide interchange protein DsbC
MIRKLLIICCALATTLPATAWAKSFTLAETRAQMKKSFPTLTIDDVRESGISGLYEVTAGTNIIYYAPENERLVFGEIYTKEGTSITAARKQDVARQKFASLDLSKAVKVGTGPKQVVVFTDPDCPFCRRAEDFFSKRTDVTEYIFFSPIASLHPGAEAKATFILGAKDPAAAFRDTMSGKYDRESPIDTGAGQVMMREHKALAHAFAITGTPVFYINGRVITGADYRAIEDALNRVQKN